MNWKAIETSMTQQGERRSVITYSSEITHTTEKADVVNREITDNGPETDSMLRHSSQQEYDHQLGIYNHWHTSD